jgi:hypothetical protein
MIPRPFFDVVNIRGEEAPSPKRPRAEVHPFDLMDKEELNFYRNDSLTRLVLTSETLFFNGVAYPLLECGEGVFHKVFAFKEVQDITFNKVKLSTKDIVIKTYNSEEKKGKLAATIDSDIKAYESLNKKQIPLPLCYAFPNPDEKEPIWVLKRMPTPITGEGWSHGEAYEDLSKTDKKVVDFAKKYLTLNAVGIDEKQGEFIGDFNPKNVMVNSQGEPVVVDPTLPETEKWTCRKNLQLDVAHWSKGNPKIKQYLIEGFPESIKQLFEV